MRSASTRAATLMPRTAPLPISPSHALPVLLAAKPAQALGEGMTSLTAIEKAYYRRRPWWRRTVRGVVAVTLSELTCLPFLAGACLFIMWFFSNVFPADVEAYPAAERGSAGMWAVGGAVGLACLVAAFPSSSHPGRRLAWAPTFAAFAGLVTRFFQVPGFESGGVACNLFLFGGMLTSALLYWSYCISQKWEEWW